MGDGQQLTGSEGDALRRFRPAVIVDGDAIHIEDRGIWTPAGVTAGMGPAHPPFDSGDPDRAPEAAKAAVFPQYEKARAAFREGIARAM